MNEGCNYKIGSYREKDTITLGFIYGSYTDAVEVYELNNPCSKCGTRHFIGYKRK